LAFLRPGKEILTSRRVEQPHLCFSEVQMHSLAETIKRALTAAGPATADRVRGLIAEFECVSLSDEERLTAIASAIAAIACTQHRRHKPVYLDAVKTWSLEIAAEQHPAPLRLRQRVEVERVEDAADLLTTGVDTLVESMATLPIRTQDRVVTELSIMARLLGQYDAYTVRLALTAVEAAVLAEDFVPGDIVAIPVRDAVLPLGREADLENLAPRGFA
jgi:hypothetical protein